MAGHSKKQGLEKHARFLSMISACRVRVDVLNAAQVLRCQLSILLNAVISLKLEAVSKYTSTFPNRSHQGVEDLFYFRVVNFRGANCFFVGGVQMLENWY